jgi:hypothetical protein
MRRLLTALIASLLFGSFACHRAPAPELMTFDIDEALKNKGELRLSNIAAGVGLVQLSGLDSATYISPQTWQYYAGDRVICVFNANPPEFLLFNNNGHFIRKIGNAGKGPGEFNGTMPVFAIDEKRETILIADNDQKKLILYRFSGEMVMEQPYGSFHGIAMSYCLNLVNLDNGNFILKNQLLPNFTDISYEVLELDPQLRLVRCIKPERPEKGSTTLWYGSNTLYRLGDQVRFWTPGQDTLFGINGDKAVPLYCFRINDAPTPEERLSSDDNGKLSASRLLETEKFILVKCNKGYEQFLIICEKSTGRAYRNRASGKCGFPGNEMIGMNNDLFGFCPAFISDITAFNQGKLVLILHPGVIESSAEWLGKTMAECLKEATVSMPAKRDELIRLLENPDENRGPVLAIVSLK